MLIIIFYLIVQDQSLNNVFQGGLRQLAENISHVDLNCERRFSYLIKLSQVDAFPTKGKQS